MKYTTGEIARLCGITVRAVQFYDNKGLVVPCETSDGGRRLYSEEDLEKMRVVCFLRDTGVSVSAISELFRDEHCNQSVLALIERQTSLVKDELEDCKARLDKLSAVRRIIKDSKTESPMSIAGVIRSVNMKKELKKIHLTMLFVGIPLSILQCVSILLWIFKSIWIPFAVWAPLAVIYGVWVSIYYFKSVAYICPECNKVFKPTFKEAFFARHTPTLRRLTCPVCGEKRFCIETSAKELDNNDA